MLYFLRDLFLAPRYISYPDTCSLDPYRTSFSHMYTASTSVTLTITLMLLHLHPEKLSKLLSEIHATFPVPSEPITYTKCKKMQYLKAVISETMRFYPIVGPGWMPRTFPYDLRVGDVIVPKDTEIVSSVYTLQHTEEYW